MRLGPARPGPPPGPIRVSPSTGRGPRSTPVLPGSGRPRKFLLFRDPLPSFKHGSVRVARRALRPRLNAASVLTQRPPSYIRVSSSPRLPSLRTACAPRPLAASALPRAALPSFRSHPSGVPAPLSSPMLERNIARWHVLVRSASPSWRGGCKICGVNAKHADLSQTRHSGCASAALTLPRL